MWKNLFERNQCHPFVSYLHYYSSSLGGILYCKATLENGWGLTVWYFSRLLHFVRSCLARIIQVLLPVCPIFGGSQFHFSPRRRLGPVLIVHNLSMLHMLAQRGVDATLSQPL